MLGQHVLDRLDDDDRVVDDDADRQHQRQQRDRVGRKAERQHHSKAADQRHRHRDDRHQCRAQPAEKDEHDDRHQPKGFEERGDHLVDRGGDKDRRVVGDFPGHVGREAFGHLPHRAPHRGRRRNRVGARRQIDPHCRGRLAVKARNHIGRLRTEFDPRHVAHPDQRAVRLGAHDDRAELLGGFEPALGGQRDRALLRLDHRCAAYAADRGLDVLRAYRGDHLVRRQPEPGQPVHVEPDAHRIVLLAKQIGLADPRDAADRVADVDQHVVGQKQAVARPFGRAQHDDLQDRRGRLFDLDTALLHLGRQPCHRPLHPVLDIDGVGFGIGTDGERYGEAIGPVIARGRPHVQHAGHAVDLALDNLGDGLLDDFGIGAGVAGRDRHLGRYDVGKLRDWDRGERDQPGQGDQDRDHDREPRAIDKNRRNHPRLPGSAPDQARGAGLGATVMPERTRAWPCTMTRSPAASPFFTTAVPSRCISTLTGRMSALFWASTTKT